MLGSAVAQHQPLMTAARGTAAADTAGLVERGQALTADHLGDSLPGVFKDFMDSAEAHRSEVTKPLYDVADNASINLAAHPDLLEHYVLRPDFAKYLVKEAPKMVSNPADVRNIARFLDNREGVVSAGNDVLKNYRNVPTYGQKLNAVHSAAINDHIARRGADFSLPRPLVRGYLDALAASRPSISQAYSKLQPNDYGEVDRLVDSTKRAIGEVSPEDRAAQQAYRELSIPVNQADLARSLTKGGGVNRFDNEATSEYIAANDKLRAAAEAAGLPDNSRPLNRFVLDEAVQKKARHDAIETPQAILDTVNNVVRPRLDAVYGSGPVDDLMRDATEHAQLINNRKGLVNKGLASEDGSVKPSSVIKHGFMGAVDHAYRAIVHGGTDKRMAEFLQQHPEEAMAHIKEYMLKHPEGKLPDYEKYLSSVLGSYVGGTHHPEVTTAPSTESEWRWDGVSGRVVRVR